MRRLCPDCRDHGERRNLPHQPGRYRLVGRRPDANRSGKI